MDYYDYFKKMTKEEIVELKKNEYEQMKELIETLDMMKDETNGEELVNAFLHGTSEEFINLLKINKLLNQLT